jgi:hypothetical protein
MVTKNIQRKVLWKICFPRLPWYGVILPKQNTEEAKEAPEEEWGKEMEKDPYKQEHCRSRPHTTFSSSVYLCLM